MMKRNIATLLVGLMIFGSNLMAFAQESYSDWAKEMILFAKKCNVLTEANLWDYQQPMTRGELAPILLRAYENATENQAPLIEESYFEDASYEADALYELGIMNGTGDGVFSPEVQVTREQIAKIIVTVKAVCEGEEMSLPPAYYNPLTDFMSVAQWAKPYVEQAYNEGIITGYEDGSFQPQKTVSREETVALLVRSLELKEIQIPMEEEPEQEQLYWEADEFSWNVDSNWEAGEQTILWSKLSRGSEFVLQISEQRNSRYEGDIAPNILEYHYVDSYAHTMYFYPNRTYHITLIAGEQQLEAELYVPHLSLEDMTQLSESVPETKEEADAVMTEITVPVWKMKGDGTKYESSSQLTVHSAIADKVVLVFTEIFNGKEQFPIKDLGGYSWRGGRSEHNWGTAIDLNANENYCLYNDGTAVGDGWFPYENPYSVTPYGDVVNAFEKHGFTWGGDAWSNPKDYMHFSYLGT